MIAHLPVLLREVMEILEPERGGVYVDATAGLGGHAREMLRRIGPKGSLVGIDRDEEALKMAQSALASENGKAVFELRHARFSELDSVLDGLGINNIDGILFDLGVSMLQLKGADRGFSFNSDEPLDMRMDKMSGSPTACDVLDTYSEAGLRRIFGEYGEERYAGRIARQVVFLRRKGTPVRTGRELSRIALTAYHGGGREKIHPATRIFQALRIEVNRELEELKAGLDFSRRRLSKGGRIAVISYHSLEDRIVKHFLKDAAREGEFLLLSKKPVRPGPRETRENPAARSAKLRGAERL